MGVGENERARVSGKIRLSFKVEISNSMEER